MTYRKILALVLAVMPLPAAAQLYWKPADLSGAPLVAYEEGMGAPLPGANATEQNAAIIWNMRAGLNAAALQCGFEPSFRTLENYNAILSDHNAELTASFNTLSAYFKRVNDTPAASQKAFDTFGTRTYSGFSTVQAQYDFCTAAGKVGRIALFTPRGSFATMAREHLRELRNGLKQSGEQQFPGARTRQLKLPSFADKCWKKGVYQSSCGFD